MRCDSLKRIYIDIDIYLYIYEQIVKDRRRDFLDRREREQERESFCFFYSSLSTP